MAIFHMNTKIISRSKGQSAIASASYRSGEMLYSERYNKMSMYHREVQPESFILLPEGIPSYLENRETLWNEIEKVEVNKNSRLAREFDIALPIELNNEQQKSLIKDFVNTNFVNNGLIVDVSIHRDHVENPHFHVMIPSRKFNEKGEALPKSKKEYLKDEKGDFIYNEKGNKKTRNVDLLNLSSKENLLSWRKSWADITNKHLNDIGSDERISHKSYKELGSEIKPTIHEGYVARKMEQRGDVSDRININNSIKEHNKLIKSKHDINQEIEKIKSVENVERFFSDDELSHVKELTKELKSFVSFDSLNEKERSLNNWYVNSVTNKNIKINHANINPEINKQFEAVHKANEILNQESYRLIKGYYSFVDTEKISDYQARGLANKTLINDNLLNKEDVKKELVKLQLEEPKMIMAKIINRPFDNLKLIENKVNNNEDKINSIKKEYGIQTFNEQNIATLTDEDKDKMKFIVKDNNRLELLKNKLNSHYDEILSKELSDKAINKLHLSQKEYLSNMKVYYDTSIVNITNKNIETPYNKNDLRYAMYFLTKNSESDRENIKNINLKELVTDTRFTSIVINDCIYNLNMSENEMNLLKQTIKDRNKYLGNVDLNDEDFENIYKINSSNSTLSTLFSTNELEQIENEVKSNEREKIIADKKIMNQNNSPKRR